MRNLQETAKVQQFFDFYKKWHKKNRYLFRGWKSFKSFKRTCGAVLKVGYLWKVSKFHAAEPLVSNKKTRRINASAPHNASVIGDPAEHLTDDGETNKQQKNNLNQQQFHDKAKLYFILS